MLVVVLGFHNPKQSEEMRRFGLTGRTQSQHGNSGKPRMCRFIRNYAFRRLNTRVSVFSFYEAATDPIFQPLDLFEFSLQFGCGSLLKFRDDFACVEIDAHEGDPEVKLAGLMLRFNSTPTRADQRHGFQSARAVR